MRTRALFTSAAFILGLLACAPAARAQETDAPKFEIGVQYTSLSFNLPRVGGTVNAPGVGARVTYNLNNYFAVEAEGNIFPSVTPSDYTTGGDSQQAQFGVKAGKRWRRWGLFAKARPGFVSFADTFIPVQTESGGVPVFRLDRERKTHFSMDVGGVLEFYPSRRMLVRFDAGDTIIRYGEHAEFVPFHVSPSGIGPVPAETTHNFQFSAGLGFRFGGGDDDDGGAPQTPSARGRRFEVGAQFSSLVLQPPTNGPVFFTSFDEGSEAEAGGGARFGYNATDNLAFEIEGNFYPRRRFGINTAIGGYPSQVQAGVKYGRRFDRFGVFGKARPGVVHFSSVNEVTGYEAFDFGGETFLFPTFRDTSKTYFSMDVGGVFEFYPTSRIFTRFDVGDTMIRYPVRDSPSGAFITPPPRLPAELRHNLQVTAGIGFRF
jgi:Outer membrane protein beta-barrel domain